MEEKSCFKCGKVLPLTDFYKHKQMPDGHLNKCKECNKQESRRNYTRKIVDPEWKLKERERSRVKMRVARKNGRYNITLKEKKQLYEKAYRDKYPEKYSAHILSQRIPIEPCIVCGTTENIERHHEDYLKPLDITFLCKKHHYERHIEIRKQQLLNGTKEEN